MLGAESWIPVDFRVIESEEAILLLDVYLHIVWTGEDLVAESSELVFLTYVVDFVDDGSDGGVFV